MSVIEIRFHEDLSPPILNKLRYRMELAAWEARVRKAQEEKDYDTLDRLDREYELIGLP